MLEKAYSEAQGPMKLSTVKKSKLNLLNPMSLLNRRRNSGNQTESSNLSINTNHVPPLPDNFDPSIRGTITHDFSLPRTRRNHSYAADGNNRDFLSPAQSIPVDKVPPKLQPTQGPAPTHSPMFKEHFQDDRQALRPADTAYLHNMASQGASFADLGGNLPAFAKRLPARLPNHIESDATTEILNLDRPLPEPPISPPSENPALFLPKEPLQPPPPPPERIPSVGVSLRHVSGLPKHMTSTSSRFSFQLGGQASSNQEKLLEEKHKQIKTTKHVSSLSHGEDIEEDNFDDYDLDAEDFEEEIPFSGINDDEEDGDGFTNNINQPMHNLYLQNLPALQQPSLQGFHFTPQSMTFSPTSTNHASQPTPRDDQGFPIGIAGSRDSAEYMQRMADQEPSDEMKVAFFDGLGITTSSAANSTTQTPMKGSQTEAFDDSELYFDDGEFDDHGDLTGEDAFDEDILDDETKIRDIPAENARKYEAAVQNQGQDADIQVLAPKSSVGSSVEATDSHTAQKARSTIIGLTEGNLAAYHDALANAANEAAANGKFRNVSFSQASDDDTSQSHLGIISDESRLSYNVNRSTIAEDDGFPFDDDVDDEDAWMIAEANAEALENDDDGFYGQEFGFYARAPRKDKDNSEMINGGFFASRGSNGVKRSHSGRGNFQEPSLTPITERSEWSARNSVANLQIPPGFGGAMPGSANSIPSPGIAQFRELDSAGSYYADDSDMTLSALMKLRRGAFGGSSNSIGSSHSQGTGGGAHSSSSPLGYGPFSPSDHVYGHSRLPGSKHSIHSAGIPESEEEDDDDEGFNEHTVTHNTPSKKSVEPAVPNQHPPQPQPQSPPHFQFPPHQPSTPLDQTLMSPLSINSAASGDGGMKRAGHHSRTSSGAESVSYARESDGRWVIERRRTGEDGGVEVFDREYLAGARI
jgi:hypothetical protein